MVDEWLQAPPVGTTSSGAVAASSTAWAILADRQGQLFGPKIVTLGAHARRSRSPQRSREACND